MDRLKQMRLFLRVADMSSFTRAADDLGLPKAAVSNAIQDLEDGLGTRLLHRTTRKVQLTQDGLAFYEKSRALLAEADRVENMFRQGGARIEGRIRFDMPTRMAREIVIPRLPEFLAEHPGIEFEISSTDRKVDLIREGFDCVLRVGKMTDSDLVARRIGEMPLINVVSPGYVARHGQPRGVADLPRHRLVHYSPQLGSWNDGFEYFDGHRYVTVPMKGVVSVNNAENFLTACLAGFGIIQVPEAPVRKLLRERRLIEVLPRLRAEPMPVHIVYPHRRHLPQRVVVFMDWLHRTVAAAQKS